MKKIALITDGWGRYVTYTWIQGYRNYMAAHQSDMDLYIFQSFGNFSMDEKHNAGEYNIARLPDFSEFDGILLDLATVSQSDLIAEIIERAKLSNIPAISLLEQIPGLYHSGIDNYEAITRIVEHLIAEHGCRTLNFIGGPEFNRENQLRFKAYRDALLRHGIPFDEQRVIHHNYEIETGIQAFSTFKEKNLLPDAFVCVNDNTAVGVCLAAKEAGYSIPGDFLVTGFDNEDKASYYEPRITTVGFSKADIMENALFQNANSIFHGTLVLRLLYLGRENERVVVLRPLGVIPVQFRGDPVTVCNHGLLAVVADNKRRDATKVLQSMVIHRNPLRLPRRGHSLRINVLGVW